MNSLHLTPFLAFALALPATLSAQTTLFSEDFSTDPSLVNNTTVPDPDTWYINATRYSWNEATEAVRRSSGSPTGYTGLTYGFTPAAAVSNDLTLSFTYNMDFTDITVTIALYGAETTFGGGGGTRLRTDGINPGSNWGILNQKSVTLSGAGTESLSWLFIDTSYAHVGFQIATTDLTSGGGSFFDITSVQLDQAAIPEPSTYATLLGFAVLGLAAFRRQHHR